LEKVYSLIALIADFIKGLSSKADFVSEAFTKVFGDLWKLIKDILENFSSLSEIAEDTIRVMKHS